MNRKNIGNKGSVLEFSQELPKKQINDHSYLEVPVLYESDVNPKLLESVQKRSSFIVSKKTHQIDCLTATKT